MPAVQRGQVYRVGPHCWGLRHYDADGERRRVSPFDSNSAALRHFRDVIEPQLRGEPAPAPELMLSELVELYLDRHAASVRPRTVAVLRERLGHAIRAFSDVPLPELERMTGELASWRAKLPERLALRDHAGAQADARRRRPLGVHEPPPGEAGGPQPAAAAQAGAGLHAGRAGGLAAELSPSTGRCQRSRPLPGCGRRSGRRSNVVTSTARAAPST